MSEFETDIALLEDEESSDEDFAQDESLEDWTNTLGPDEEAGLPLVTRRLIHLPDVPDEDGLRPTNGKKLANMISKFDFSTFRHVDLGVPRSELVDAGVVPSLILRSEVLPFLFDVAKAQQTRKGQVHSNRYDITDIMAYDHQQLYRTKTDRELLFLVASGMSKEVRRVLSKRELSSEIISQLRRPEDEVVDKTRSIVYLGWLCITLRQFDRNGDLASEHFEYHQYVGSGTGAQGGIVRIAQYVIWKCKAVEQGLYPNGKMTSFVRCLIRPCTTAAIRVLWSRPMMDVTRSEVIHVEGVMTDVLRAIPFNAVSPTVEGGSFGPHSRAARSAYQEVIGALPPLKSEAISGLNGSSPYRQGAHLRGDGISAMDPVCGVPACTRPSIANITILRSAGKAKLAMCSTHARRYRDGEFKWFKKVEEWLEDKGPSINQGMIDVRRKLDRNTPCGLDDCMNQIKYLIEIHTLAGEPVPICVCQFHMSRWRECEDKCAMSTWEDFEKWRLDGAPTSGVLRGLRRTESELAALGCDIPSCEGSLRETTKRFDSTGSEVALHLCQTHASRLRSCVGISAKKPVSAIDWHQWVEMKCPTAGVWKKRDIV